MVDLVEKARVFATAAHRAVGQTRKYTGEAYIVHPASVANIVQLMHGTPEMVAAAWLHDVVEDTMIGLSVIQQEFGEEVATLVATLTNLDPAECTRAQKKDIERKVIAEASPAAKTIKLADILDNLQTLDTIGYSAFAKVYVREKLQLLMSLIDGDPRLWVQVYKLLEDLQAQFQQNK